METLAKGISLNCCWDRNIMKQDNRSSQIQFQSHRPSYKLKDLNDIRNNYHERERGSFVTPIKDNTKISQVKTAYNDENNRMELVKRESRRKSLLSSYCQTDIKFGVLNSQKKFVYHQEAKKQEQNNVQLSMKQESGARYSRRSFISLGGSKQSDDNLRQIQQTKSKFQLRKTMDSLRQEQPNRYTIGPIVNRQDLRNNVTNDKRRITFQYPPRNTQKRTVLKQKKVQFSFSNLNQSHMKSFYQLSNSTTIENSKYLSRHVGLQSKMSEQIPIKRFRVDSCFRKSIGENFRVSTVRIRDFSKENYISAGNNRAIQFFNSEVKNFKVPSDSRYNSFQKPVNSLPLTFNTDNIRIQIPPSLLKKQIHILQQNLSHLQVQQSHLTSQIAKQKSHFQHQYEELIGKKLKCEQKLHERQKDLHQLKDMFLIAKFNQSL